MIKLDLIISDEAKFALSESDSVTPTCTVRFAAGVSCECPIAINKISDIDAATATVYAIPNLGSSRIEVVFYYRGHRYKQMHFTRTVKDGILEFNFSLNTSQRG